MRDLAAEIYVQLISKVPDPGKAESMAKLSFKLAELFQQVDDARIHAAKPVAADFNAGGELALGGTYFVRAGIGATAALVADGFYGAGTRETRAAFYPVVSGQLGVSVNYEVLP